MSRNSIFIYLKINYLCSKFKQLRNCQASHSASPWTRRLRMKKLWLLLHLHISYFPICFSFPNYVLIIQFCIDFSTWVIHVASYATAFLIRVLLQCKFLNLTASFDERFDGSLAELHGRLLERFSCRGLFELRTWCCQGTFSTMVFPDSSTYS